MYALRSLVEASRYPRGFAVFLVPFFFFAPFLVAPTRLFAIFFLVFFFGGTWKASPGSAI